MKEPRMRLRKQRGGAEVLMIEDDGSLTKVPKQVDYSIPLSRLTGESNDKDYKQAFSKLTGEQPKNKVSGIKTLMYGIKDAIQLGFTADTDVDSNTLCGFIYDRVVNSDDTLVDIVSAIIQKTFPFIQGSKVSDVSYKVIDLLASVAPTISFLCRYFFTGYSVIAVAFAAVIKYATDKPVREILNIKISDNSKKDSKQSKSSNTKKKVTIEAMDKNTSTEDINAIQEERMRENTAKKATSKKQKQSKGPLTEEQMQEEFKKYQEQYERFKREHYGMGSGQFSNDSVGGALFSLDKGFAKFINVLISIVLYLTKRIIYFLVLLYNLFTNTKWIQIWVMISPLMIFYSVI